MKFSSGHPAHRGFQVSFGKFAGFLHFSGVFTFFHDERTLIHHGLTFFRVG